MVERERIVIGGAGVAEWVRSENEDRVGKDDWARGEE